MTDDELDELILSRLRSRRRQGDATQSPTDIAAAFNEPESGVESRVHALAAQARIKESADASSRWVLT